MAGGNAEGGAGAADCSLSRAVPPRDHVIVCDAVGKGGGRIAATPQLFSLVTKFSGKILVPPTTSVAACPAASLVVNVHKHPCDGLGPHVWKKWARGELNPHVLTDTRT